LILEQEIRAKEWGVLERFTGVLDQGALVTKWKKNVRWVGLVASDQCQWFTVRDWPFGSERADRLSQVLNTITCLAAFGQAYDSNVVIRLSFMGYPMMTVMPRHYMRFLGVPVHAEPAFSGYKEALAEILEVDESSIVAGLETILDLDEDCEGAFESVATVLEAWAMFPSRWKDYFRSDSKGEAQELTVYEEHLA
jgi:hypothetical protein